MVADMYEIVASVKSIDSANRTAILQFSDGQTRTVHVRPDVDLSRYKVGDSVVIRVTSALSVLVENPELRHENQPGFPPPGRAGSWGRAA